MVDEGKNSVHRQPKDAKEQRTNGSFDNNGDGNYNRIPATELAKRYDEDVAAGWISPLCGFKNYLRLYNRVEDEIVGQKTVNGITVTDQSRHFLQRVVGTGTDPKILRETLRRVHRDGVEINDVKEALFNGSTRPARLGPNGYSQQFIGEKCVVTLDPNTGVLIQCNPKS